MINEEIERRPAQRQAFCRGCDTTIEVDQEMVSTYSIRNRGQWIHFCLPCAVYIGKLATGDNG